MKPSKITTVKAKKAWYLPPKIIALTWMGIVYCKYREDADNINSTDKIDSVLKSHETIHVRQAETMHNSWLLFYIRYIWEWIVNIPLLTINRLWKILIISIIIICVITIYDFYQIFIIKKNNKLNNILKRL